MPTPNEAELGEKDDPDEKCPNPVGEDDCCEFAFIIMPIPPLGVGIPAGIGTSPAVVISIVTGPAGPTTTTGVPARALACHISDACDAADSGAICKDEVSEGFDDDDEEEEEEEEEEGSGAITTFDELDANGVDLFSEDSGADFEGVLDAAAAAFAARASI